MVVMGRNLFQALLELLSAACLIASGAVIHTALGLFIAGIILGYVSWRLE